jgi:hypothetical protein
LSVEIHSPEPNSSLYFCREKAHLHGTARVQADSLEGARRFDCPLSWYRHSAGANLVNPVRLRLKPVCLLTPRAWAGVWPRKDQAGPSEMRGRGGRRADRSRVFIP